MNDVLVWVVVATALGFDFTNGFHDTANAVATTVSTRRPQPAVAVAIAAVLNLLGAFVWTAVAKTSPAAWSTTDSSPSVIFAGLIGAIAWNLVTWYLGLPSSLLARPVRRADRRRARRGRHRRVHWRRHRRTRSLIPAAASPRDRLRHRRRRDPAISRDRRARPAPRNRGFRYGQIAVGSLWRSRTAPTTRRRRWA